MLQDSRARNPYADALAVISAWKQLIAINNIANKIQYILFLFIVPSIIFIVFIYLFFH